MELIVTHPGGAPIVNDYLAGAPEALRFFGRHFRDPEAFRAKAAEVDRRFDREAREAAVSAMVTPPGGDPDRLARFVDEGGYVVTTGQQPGLYGGPLYSIYKALTAARLAASLEQLLDRPVLPVFWVASDDHDWDEANHAELIGVDNDLHRFEVQAPSQGTTPPLHRITLGADADGVLDAFIGHLPDTDFSGVYAELLRDGFGSGRTVPQGFHHLMQGVLGRFGVFFTDAAAPEVKRISAGRLLHELESAETLEGVLRETAAALESAGYGLQVPILEGGVNLFLEGPGGRERLYRDEEGGFRLRSSGTRLTMDEIRARAADDPTVLSPNVLFRPVVESSVFPTLSYVGGPGEMAYFAQICAYFDAHGIEMPIVHPRWAAAPVESKIRKVLDKFALDVPALNRPFHEVASDIARDEVPADVRAAIGKLRGAIGAGVGELQKATTAVDPTLKGPVQHFRGQAFAALDDVEKKVVQAVKRESEIALAQLEKAQLHLYPGGKPAERVQSPIYFLARYGGTFLDDLYERFALNFD